MEKFNPSTRKLLDLLTLRCQRYGWTLATQEELKLGAGIRDTKALRRGVDQLVNAGLLEVRDFTVQGFNIKRGYRLRHITPQDKSGAVVWGSLTAMAAMPDGIKSKTLYGLL